MVFIELAIAYGLCAIAATVGAYVSDAEVKKTFEEIEKLDALLTHDGNRVLLDQKEFKELHLNIKKLEQQMREQKQSWTKPLWQHAVSGLAIQCKNCLVEAKLILETHSDVPSALKAIKEVEILLEDGNSEPAGHHPEFLNLLRTNKQTLKEIEQDLQGRNVSKGMLEYKAFNKKVNALLQKLENTAALTQTAHHSAGARHNDNIHHVSGPHTSA